MFREGWELSRTKAFLFINHEATYDSTMQINGTKVMKQVTLKSLGYYDPSRQFPRNPPLLVNRTTMEEMRASDQKYPTVCSLVQPPSGSIVSFKPETSSYFEWFDRHPLFFSPTGW